MGLSVCQDGNGSIYAYCHARLLEQGLRTNKERREAIQSHGGCLNPLTLEVIVSIQKVAADVAAVLDK